MPAITSTAPGKVILFGEHAVVYGHPAIAIPVNQVQARAIVMPEPRRPRGQVRIQAPDIHLEAIFDDLPSYHPLSRTIAGVFKELKLLTPPACTVRVTSSIPQAAGMGSGAAVSVAIIRALSTFLGRPLPPERVSALAYEVEKLHHGTPSGIDNTVITYAMPVYYVRDQPIQILRLAAPFTLVIGDTGVRSPTAVAVGDLRQAQQANPAPYDALFVSIGEIVQQARQVIENGTLSKLGSLMDQNHACLQQLGVSSAELDHLVEVARSGGASGAKLSGSGRGGNMIALATPETAPSISQALLNAGAAQTLITTIQ
jgi:mevalonate kinase